MVARGGFMVTGGGFKDTCVRCVVAWGGFMVTGDEFTVAGNTFRDTWGGFKDTEGRFTCGDKKLMHGLGGIVVEILEPNHIVQIQPLPLLLSHRCNQPIASQIIWN
jgi:hypothetical protein